MSEFGVVTAPRTLCIRRVLPGPIERVWAYLTESEKRGQLARRRPDGAPGRRAGGAELPPRGLCAPLEPTPEKYRQYEGGVTVHGRITRCEPPRLLSYTWGGNGGEPSEVTFELTPGGGDVLLVLTHRRLGDRAQMVSVAAAGTRTSAFSSTISRAASRQPFWSTFARMEAEYDRRLPAD